MDCLKAAFIDITIKIKKLLYVNKFSVATEPRKIIMYFLIASLGIKSLDSLNNCSFNYITD